MVEAGGNGGEDLDLVDESGRRQFLRSARPGLPRFRRDHRRCGVRPAPHSRLGFSSFGGRIDCYGWGNGVDTLRRRWTGTATTAYTGSFGGTSSASPIVAGAALAVQGAVEAAAGLRLSPAQLRAVLTDPATSTPSAIRRWTASASCRTCGRSSRMASSTCAPTSISATSWATAETRMPGAISASPDVILGPTTVADAQAAFGEGSGTENLNKLGHEATAGQDNYVYIRAKNRGGSMGRERRRRSFGRRPRPW